MIEQPDLENITYSAIYADAASFTASAPALKGGSWSSRSRPCWAGGFQG